MYLEHFGLQEGPFSITPDPRFVFLTQRHREALAHLVYGLGEGGGFVQLTGEVGTGKTTICRTLLHQLPEHVDVALIFNPPLTVSDLLDGLFKELHIPRPEGNTSDRALMDRLYDHLLQTNASGRRTVLIIDEAQNLDEPLLEQVRLLTNLETDDAKLLQVFLIGQPELRDLLQRRELRQVAQRITARYHLEPLDRHETAQYVSHRLAVAGCHRQLFTASSLRRVQRLSRGIPRRINILCDRALLGAYASDAETVTRAIVSRAQRELDGRHAPALRTRPALVVGAAVVAVAGSMVLSSGYAPVLMQLARDAMDDVRAGESQSDESAAPAVSSAAAAATPAPPPADSVPAPAAPVPPPTAAAVRPTTAAPQVQGAEVVDAPPVAAPLASIPASDASPARPAAPTLPAEAESTDGSGGAIAAAAAAPLVEAPRVPDLAEQVAGATGDGLPSALAALAGRWQLPPPAGGVSPCEWGARHELSCYTRPLLWDELVALDLPAVLSLPRAGAARVYLALLRVSGEEATVDLAGERRMVPVSTLQALWRGEHYLLWPTPDSGEPLIKLGQGGAAVRWLRRMLQAVDGQPARPEQDFDQALLSRVKAFQQQQGLKVDGIVGPQTAILLQNAAAPERMPLLRAPVAPRARAAGTAAAGA
jgi:general secretion pathway protein A